MATKFTYDLVSRAYHGIDENIDADETVEVNLRDLLKVHATLGELIRFFHQPMHYENLGDVAEYLGSKETNGGYRLMSDAYYKLMERMLPDRLDALFEGNAFDSPELPYYFAPKK